MAARPRPGDRKATHPERLEGRPLDVSLDAGRYKHKPQLHPEWWTYRTIEKAVELLESEATGFIIKRTGYNNPEDGVGFITKLYASDRLLGLFDKYAPISYDTRSHQTLVLRNDFKEDVTNRHKKAPSKGEALKNLFDGLDHKRAADKHRATAYQTDHRYARRLRDCGALIR